MQEVLHARYYNICETEQENFFVQTKSQAKISGAVLPKVHAVDKSVI